MNKGYSLKKSYDIEKLVKIKKSVGTKNYAIYYTENEKLKIALAVNKKYGNAVERNKAKRIVREILRSKIEKLPKIQMLVVIKKTSKDLSFIEKDNEFEYMIRKIKKNINNKEFKNEERKK